MTIVRLIRHGKAQYVQKELASGETYCDDNGLCEEGKKQVRSIASALGRVVADSSVIIASDSPRAIETATIIQKEIQNTRISQETLDSLQVTKNSVVTINKNIPELENGLGKAENNMIWGVSSLNNITHIRDGANAVIGAAHPSTYIAEETLQVLDKQMNKGDEKDILVCTHGLAIRLLVNMIRHQNTRDVAGTYMPHASVTRIDFPDVLSPEVQVQYMGALAERLLMKEDQIELKRKYTRPQESHRYF